MWCREMDSGGADPEQLITPLFTKLIKKGIEKINGSHCHKLKCGYSVDVT